MIEPPRVRNGIHAGLVAVSPLAKELVFTVEATVSTGRATRYLTQLCRHAVQMGRHVPPSPRAHGEAEVPPKVQHVESNDTEGVIVFDGGTCSLRVTEDALVLRVDAPDLRSRRLLQDGLTARLEKMGRRDGLKVNWQESGAPTAPQNAKNQALPESASVSRRGGHRQVVILSAVGLLVVAAHLGLGGALLESSQWAGWAANFVLAVVVLKLLAVAGHVFLGRLAVRRARSVKGR